MNNIDPEEKKDLQDALVGEFPTISILDVERTGRTILSIVRQMTWALQVMAGLSILAGLTILFSVSREKAHKLRWELNLQKILGASFTDLRNQVRLEFGLLALFASLVGASLSALVSYVFAEVIFDRVWSFHWGLPCAITAIVVALSVLTAEFAAKKVLKMKPAYLLHEH